MISAQKMIKAETAGNCCSRCSKYGPQVLKRIIADARDVHVTGRTFNMLAIQANGVRLYGPGLTRHGKGLPR